MAKKLTVAELSAQVQALSDRLDKAAQVVSAQTKRIDALEAQQTKTKKQLWYLQKVAHGEFDGTKQAA